MWYHYFKTGFNDASVGNTPSSTGLNEVNESSGSTTYALYSESSQLEPSVNKTWKTVSAPHSTSADAPERADKKLSTHASVQIANPESVFDSKYAQDDLQRFHQYEYGANGNDSCSDSDSDGNIFEASSINVGSRKFVLRNSNLEGDDIDISSFGTVGDMWRGSSDEAGGSKVKKLDDDGFREPSDDEF